MFGCRKPAFSGENFEKILAIHARLDPLTFPERICKLLRQCLFNSDFPYRIPRMSAPQPERSVRPVPG